MKKLVPKRAIHGLHDARGFERREGEQQQERGDELRPDEEGSRIQVMPGARSWMIVAMKFTEPSSDAVMLKTMPISQSVCPLKK